jgi:hypothetical protein
MFSRSLRSTTTPLCSSSFASRPLFNCNQTSFLSLRQFHQTTATMSGNTQAFFDIQYAPVGSSARKSHRSPFSLLWLCLVGEAILPLLPIWQHFRGDVLLSRNRVDSAWIHPCFPNQFHLNLTLLLTMAVAVYSQDVSHHLQPLREGRP